MPGFLLPVIVIGVIFIILFWFVKAYNGFVKLRNMVREAFSTMDVYMKKRYDLIPNLVETVKGYAKHEQQTLGKCHCGPQCRGKRDYRPGENRGRKRADRNAAVAVAWPRRIRI